MRAATLKKISLSFMAVICLVLFVLVILFSTIWNIHMVGDSESFVVYDSFPVTTSHRIMGPGSILLSHRNSNRLIDGRYFIAYDMRSHEYRTNH